MTNPTCAGVWCSAPAPPLSLEAPETSGGAILFSRSVVRRSPSSGRMREGGLIWTEAVARVTGTRVYGGAPRLSLASLVPSLSRTLAVNLLMGLSEPLTSGRQASVVLGGSRVPLIPTSTAVRFSGGVPRTPAMFLATWASSLVPAASRPTRRVRASASPRMSSSKSSWMTVMSRFWLHWIRKTMRKVPIQVAGRSEHEPRVGGTRRKGQSVSHNSIERVASRNAHGELDDVR